MARNKNLLTFRQKMRCRRKERREPYEFPFHRGGSWQTFSISVTDCDQLVRWHNFVAQNSVNFLSVPWVEPLSSEIIKVLLIFALFHRDRTEGHKFCCKFTITRTEKLLIEIIVVISSSSFSWGHDVYFSTMLLSGRQCVPFVAQTTRK